MTEPSDFELLELATPYALNGVSESESAEIERWLVAAPTSVSEAFYNEVREVRETMALVSSATAVEPPPTLREDLLATVSVQPSRRLRWRSAVLAAAAAVVVGLGGISVGLALRPSAAPSTAAQVLAAPDVRTVSGQIPTGGTATVMFSRDKDAGVLVMNNVAPPAPGTVYQMWLIGDGGATSAGTMDTKAVAPSTTAVLPDLANSKALAFTVEPGNGSSQPTGQIFAELPLS